ncbi:MAG: TfoX/Sxy family protein [Rhizobiales bacterium]|nr:TfoX/Sxy family protein [Hyphomicrobiales bacterium]
MAFDDPESIRELFSAFGTVSVRRMFGGHGVFADGLMFALESDGELFLKADDLTIPKLAAENSEPFVYKAKGREVALSYWKLPERLYDEPDDFAGFAREAFGAAQRAVRMKPKTKKAPKPEPKTKKQKPKRR